MATLEFLERMATRIDRIDRKGLEQYILAAIGELKFLTFLLDQAQEGLMVVAANQEVLFVNRRMIQLLNLPDEMNHKNAVQMIPDPELSNIILSAVKQRKEIFQQEFEVLLPRPMILKINLIYEKKQAPQIFILSITNLTNTESNLRERYQLANWQAMLGLAAGIAHEIGNPLNSLTIHLKLLSKMISKVPSGERKNAESSLKAMESEMARLDQIIRNFLRATRRKPLRFEAIQINDLLQKTLLFLKPELKHSKIKVIEDFGKDIPVFLIDPDRIQQVFVNIIKNAIHAMPKGGTLKINTEGKEKLCMIHFQDTGVGIFPDMVPRIFDAYYTTKEEGSGLGLMIVHQIIKEHGGRIEVQSKPNQGSTFTVLLPIRKQRLRLPEPKNGREQ